MSDDDLSIESLQTLSRTADQWLMLADRMTNLKRTTETDLAMNWPHMGVLDDLKPSYQAFHAFIVELLGEASTEFEKVGNFVARNCANYREQEEKTADNFHKANTGGLFTWFFSFLSAEFIW